MRIVAWILRLVVLGLAIFLIYTFVISPFLIAKARVIHIFDADSLLVLQDGRVRKVQLIGVDAPEHAGPRGDISQCYAREAEKLASAFFQNEREVRLDNDSALGETDVHGRDLRYVTLPDGQVLNEVLLQEGAAKEFHPEQSDYSRREAFEGLAKAARAERLGLWSACGGEF